MSAPGEMCRARFLQRVEPSVQSQWIQEAGKKLGCPECCRLGSWFRLSRLLGPSACPTCAKSQAARAFVCELKQHVWTEGWGPLLGVCLASSPRCMRSGAQGKHRLSCTVKRMGYKDGQTTSGHWTGGGNQCHKKTHQSKNWNDE